MQKAADKAVSKNRNLRKRTVLVQTIQKRKLFSYCRCQPVDLQPPNSFKRSSRTGNQGNIMVERAEAVKHEVIRWITSQRPDYDPELTEIDLIETRAIDSMRFLDFVYLISELCGRDIDREISVDDLRTISSIQSFVLKHSGSEKA